MASIAERILQRRGGSLETTQQWVFRQGLPPTRRPVAWLVGLFARDAFSHDRLVVTEFCRAKSRSDVADAINLLHRAPAYEHGFVRHTLGCRISGRRLSALAAELFARD